ncbi:MAG: ATP-binding protein [Candidatus Thiodiazotropha sp. (ex Epidulcina cf. delphinae)]|nr:ATP-binding protein [Candidatus Thiodiazotropha sp. (ex Epidulcina cf. delphinae)]MCU7926831.1 ATP-binding protein [Candidatus Thiodiazotropha sp. (ex Dulcina madagascariensis)]
MSTQTLLQLRQLKLGGMAHALQTQLEQVGTYEGLPFIKRLALLLEQENLSRDQRKQERLIRQARFKLNATDPWYVSIGDNTLADAILDRLMHNAHRLPLEGESMRKRMGQLTEDEHLS